MIAIVDYGVGNLFSLSSSLRAVLKDETNETVTVTGDADLLRDADKIILPGVGAFSDAANKLKEGGLADVVVEEAKGGKPLLGICLGMQLLLSESHEYGVHKGLGLIDGVIRPIEEVIPRDYKIPHIGWNALHFHGGTCPLFSDIKEGDYVYFVHSYHATDCDDVVATCEYGGELTAAVAKGNVFGCQFHPEKSGDVGLRILKSFCRL